MGPQWEHNGNKMGTKWEQNGTNLGLKWDQNGTKMGLEREQNGNKMGTKWVNKGPIRYQKGPRVQEGTKSISSCCENK